MLCHASVYTVISWDDDDDDDIVIEWYYYEDGAKQFRDIIYWMGTTNTHALCDVEKKKRFQRGVSNSEYICPLSLPRVCVRVGLLYIVINVVVAFLCRLIFSRLYLFV